MTPSWTAHLLLASPKPPRSDTRGHSRWIFALGPCWVRATVVAHGRQRSPAVTDGSDKPQVAGP
jgi:hypothetical protein